jgi:hypothetical protein
VSDLTETREVFVEKREGERIRIGFNEYEGREYIDIRQQYQTEEEEWRPTKKGVTLPADKLDELKEAVARL